MEKVYPKRVGSRTLVMVQQVLVRSVHPLSIGELCKLTNKSYPTIKRAVEELGAREIDGYPRRFELLGVQDPQIGDSAINVLVPLVESLDWASKWNKGAERLSANVGKIAIGRTSDPKALAASFTTGAETFASIAYALEQVMDRPDWYELLGGEPDEALPAD